MRAIIKHALSVGVSAQVEQLRQLVERVQDLHCASIAQRLLIAVGRITHRAHLRRDGGGDTRWCVLDHDAMGRDDAHRRGRVQEDVGCRLAPAIIERSVEQTHIWLKELAQELHGADRAYAYSALRAVLHALRDQLTVDVAAKFSAQLPTLVRGIYYEGWDPSRTPLHHDVDAFLEQVAREGRMAGETEASFAVAAVARLLSRHLSGGEIDEVLAVLPERYRTLIES